MPKLINLESSSIDRWQKLESGAELPNDLSMTLLPLDMYLTLKESSDVGGVWLSSADDVYLLEERLDKIPLIACQFDAFTDGRSFSQARILREHMQYQGTIRAIGAFIQDQLHYLLRCGFTEFSVDDQANEESLRQSLNDFSESYQAACDVPAPLFRRRA